MVILLSWLSPIRGKKFSISRGTCTDTDAHSVSFAVSLSVTQTDEFSKLSVIR